MKEFKPLTAQGVLPAVMTPAEIAEACEVAAEVLEGNWIRGFWFYEVRPDSPRYDVADVEVGSVKMCVEGALIAAIWGTPENLVDPNERPEMTDPLMACPVYNAVLDTVNKMWKERDSEDGESYGADYWDDLNSWNDGTAEEQEVLDILHRTAKRMWGVEG